MKPGGGKNKGSSWERATGSALSLWISEGARSDLFARNVTSGGQFTTKLKAASNELATPGDLMANHPDANEFLGLFSVECKHMADIGLEAYLFDVKRSSFLIRTYDHTAAQGAKLGLRPLVVAKQNLRPAIMLADRSTTEALLHACSKRLGHPLHHRTHGLEIGMFDFYATLAMVSYPRFVSYMK